LGSSIETVISRYHFDCAAMSLTTHVNRTDLYHTMDVVYRNVTGMLTVGNMMSLVTKGKVKVTDTVGKAIYKQFKQVNFMRFFMLFF
jgi:hypothetical protein